MQNNILSKINPLGLLRIVLLTVFPLLLLVGAVSVSKKLGEHNQTPPSSEDSQDEFQWEVDTLELKPEEVQLDIEGFGTVKSEREVMLTSEISGRVVSISENFQVGHFIGENELLIEIEATSYQNEFDLAKTYLEQSRTELQLLKSSKPFLEGKIKLLKERVSFAEKEVNRFTQLYNAQHSSKKDLESATGVYLQVKESLLNAEESLEKFPYEVQKAESIVKQHEISLEKAQWNLTKTKIHAPFSAQVVTKKVEVGQYLNAGSEIGSFFYDKVYEITLNIPPEMLKNIPYVPVNNLPGKMQSLSKIIGVPTASIEWFIFGKQYYWEGKLARIEPIEPETRTVPMVIRVENPWDALKDQKSPPLLTGAFCKVFVRGKKIKDAMVIPEEALRENDSVYLFQNGKLVIKPVAVSRILQNRVVIEPIENSVSFGEKLIISPVPYPVAGMALKQREESLK